MGDTYIKSELSKGIEQIGIKLTLKIWEVVERKKVNIQKAQNYITSKWKHHECTYSELFTKCVKLLGFNIHEQVVMHIQMFPFSAFSNIKADSHC